MRYNEEQRVRTWDPGVFTSGGQMGWLSVVLIVMEGQSIIRESGERADGVRARTEMALGHGGCSPPHGGQNWPGKCVRGRLGVF